MEKDTLINLLLTLPPQIGQAESALLTAQWQLREHAERLQYREDALLLGGQIDGKNEAARMAQIRTACGEERHALLILEQEVAVRKAALHALQAEHSSLKCIARLLGGEGA